MTFQNDVIILCFSTMTWTKRSRSSLYVMFD